MAKDTCEWQLCRLSSALTIDIIDIIDTLIKLLWQEDIQRIIGNCIVKPRSATMKKINLIGALCDDPYTFPRSELALDKWPDIEYPDIYNYLINTPNQYTNDMLKAYKSLDSYKYFVSGWVGDVCVHESGNKAILTAKVRHSQSISEKPLQPWIAIEKSGRILCAHCTCKAGLGEACSHIAAVLFAAEARTQAKKNVSCTSQPCMWLPPTMQNVGYSEIADIDFSKPITKRKRMVSGKSRQSHLTTQAVPIPTESDLESLYKELSNQGKFALLSNLTLESSETKVFSLKADFFNNFVHFLIKMKTQI